MMIMMMIMMRRVEMQCYEQNLNAERERELSTAIPTGEWSSNRRKIQCIMQRCDRRVSKGCLAARE